LTTALAAISGSETSGGFAVPLDSGLRRIVDVLKQGKEVEYGFLGVRLYEDARREDKGVRIRAVSAYSPASRGGLEGSDLIVSVNGTPTHDNDDLFLAVGTLLAGTEARLEVVRNRDPAKVMVVTLAKFYVPGKTIASQKPPPVYGLRVDYVSVLLQ